MLSNDERETLVRWSRRRSSAQALALRCRIVLACAEGLTNQAVAARVGGEVVSADSMQAYRGLPILTAQPERPTRLVGVWPLSHEGSVAEYADLAHAEIDRLLAEGSTPVVSGGTGLYLRARLGVDWMSLACGLLAFAVSTPNM